LRSATSPLLPDSRASRWSQASSEAEVAAITRLAAGREATRLAIGSGRTDSDLRTVDNLTAGWEARGGEVVSTVSWPDVAASWLRQATRFAAADADLWIMTGSPLGWAQMTRRLLWSTEWRPADTILTSSLARPEVLGLVGLADLDGITCISGSGEAWKVRDRTMVALSSARPEIF